MKPVRAYKSFDGQLFHTAKECADHETHCFAISKIVDKIPRFKRDESFQSGFSYYQHDPVLFQSVRDEFFNYIGKLYDIEEMSDNIGKSEIESHHITFITNVLKNINDVPAHLAWTEFLAYVDKDYRQWSCLYFLEYPKPEAKEIS